MVGDELGVGVVMVPEVTQIMSSAGNRCSEYQMIINEKLDIEWWH